MQMRMIDGISYRKTCCDIRIVYNFQRKIDVSEVNAHQTDLPREYYFNVLIAKTYFVSNTAILKQFRNCC